jgi:hypothetical protein
MPPVSSGNLQMDLRSAAKRCITAYLSALAEDEATVERVANGLYSHNKGTVLWEEKHEIIKDEWRSVARAALAALKGEGK